MRSWKRIPFVLGIGVAVFGCGSSTSSTTPTGSTTTDQPPGALDNLIFTADLYAPTPNNLREVYSLSSTSPGTPTRLTFTNATSPASNLEAASAPGRVALVVRRATADTNGDGVINDSDNAQVVYVGYTTPPTETVYVPSSSIVDGIDFSPAGTDIVYSGTGIGGIDDIYDIAADGSSNVDVTNTPTISESRPRYDPTGSFLAFQYLTAGLPNAVYIYDQNGNEDPIDFGASGGGGTPLPGTSYVLGGDADPSISPSGSSIVFRRLTGIPNSQGSWDVLTTNGTTVTVLATGNLFRGAPDWGANGIIYVEVDPAVGTSSIVLIAPDGSGRRVLYTAPAGYTLANPRWLH